MYLIMIKQKPTRCFMSAI